MKKVVVLVAALILTTGCTVVNYQGLAQSKDGSLYVSGNERAPFSAPTAVVLECMADGEKDYVCEKRYPADAVDLFGDLSMTRSM